MDKTKPTAAAAAATRADVDELALVKSAAWARYHHNSGSETRSLRESDVWRSTKIEPKPSRYKLEALRSARESSNYSLLDNYEIERISKQLDHYIESSHRGGSVGLAAAVEIKNEVVGKKKMEKGLWSRRVPMCGSRVDVVEGKRFDKGHSGCGRVAVAAVASCRPWPWGIS
ncbi:hypothetical protein CDL12_15449 [Handroanthus impetiginosus]|uniref:Uncharacterized protein n=1 Tax=Handroanthus impetiginosus TaxID=429701 RepID=A0A2G9H3R5_9LAMI|nr:hypothetical protein CDL12_15449 [Handroanthus impetiginosus]